MKKHEKKKCANCGRIKPKSEMKYHYNPLAAELYDDKTKKWYCIDCLTSLAGDV